MALNGTFYGTTSNAKVKPKIVWSAVQDIAGNWSDVTATLYYSRTNTGYTTAGKWEGSITINGTAKSESRNLSITYDSNTQAITNTVRVYHDDYGAKTLTISASGGIAVSSMTATTISAAIALDTIPRAAGVSAVNGDIGSRVTVVVDRKSTAFTHSLSYAFGNLTGYIKSDGTASSQEQKMTAAAVNFLLPDSFYAQIPGKANGVCTLTCRTYNGNTLIGSNTATFTATANRTLCAPQVSGTVQDINPATVALTGNSAVLVAGQSTARCTIAAQAQNSASITARSIAGQTVSGTVRTIGSIAQGGIVFSATDSRGYSAQAVVSPAFIPYVNLTCDPVARRTDPTGGNAVLTLKGKCYRGSFGSADNALTVTYQVGENEPVTVEPTLAEDHSYNLAVTLAGLDYTMSYPVRVTARDALSEVTRTLTVQKGIPVFDWGENDFQFHVPVSFGGGTRGPVSGVYIQPVRISKIDTIKLQTRFAAFNGDGGSRQSFFLFGNCNGTLVQGVIGINDAGSCWWSGTTGVTVAKGVQGQIIITLPGLAYDYFTLISAEAFEIL